MYAAKINYFSYLYKFMLSNIFTLVGSGVAVNTAIFSYLRGLKRGKEGRSVM